MRSEMGFTLIEIAAAIAIIAVITLGAGMTTAQIINVSQRSIDLTTAVRQSQNVGYWVSRDSLMAQTITIGDDPVTADDVEFIIIYQKDWETGDAHEIRYVWFDSADSLKKLKRKQLTRDKDGVEITSKTTLVADHIYSANLSWQDGVWGLSVEARSDEVSATKEYEINQRLKIE